MSVNEIVIELSKERDKVKERLLLAKENVTKLNTAYKRLSGAIEKLTGEGASSTGKAATNELVKRFIGEELKSSGGSVEKAELWELIKKRVASNGLAATGLHVRFKQSLAAFSETDNLISEKPKEEEA